MNVFSSSIFASTRILSRPALQNARRLRLSSTFAKHPTPFPAQSWNPTPVRCPYSRYYELALTDLTAVYYRGHRRPHAHIRCLVSTIKGENNMPERTRRRSILRRPRRLTSIPRSRQSGEAHLILHQQWRRLSHCGNGHIRYDAIHSIGGLHYLSRAGC